MPAPKSKILTRAQVIVDELDALYQPDVARLSTRFLELRAQLFRDMVETTIELGQILAEVRPLLRGHWQRWLERVELTPRAAINYMRLAELAQDAPKVIVDWKELGASKLYRVAALEPTARRRVLKKSERDELLGMNHREFAVLIRPHMKKRRKVTADMRAHGLRMKVIAWTEALGGAKIRGVKSDELRRGLVKDLDALARVARKRRGEL